MLNHYRLSREETAYRISENHYDPAFEAKTESLFAQANGRIGVRACFGLPSLYGKRQTYVAGLYHRAADTEVTELVNCPDITEFHLRTAAGELSPDGSFLKSFNRLFDPDTGELKIRMEFGLPDGRVLEVGEKRFASFASPELFLQEITLYARKGNFPDLVMVAAVNGQAVNEGVSHFSEVTCRVFGRKLISLHAALGDRFLSLLTLNLIEEEAEDASAFTLRRRGMEESFRLSPEEGQQVRLTRYGSFAVCTGEEETMHQREALLAAANRGYPALYRAHREAQTALHRRCDLRIEGASEEESAVLALSRYHLLAMMPWDREDCSIASKGLTGEGYHGHVFWDTDLFVQPFFTWFFPEQSRRMLRYRLGGLAGAREKAAQYGYRGAMYPWEAAADGREETPLFAAINILTGEANPVWSGRKEHHVGADICFALHQYLTFTGDPAFLPDGGYEMLFGIADFWVSRAERDPESGRLVIRDIIGPDEYTEHIDNNAYTNYMAHFSVRQALELAPRAEREAPDLCRRLSLAEKAAAWEHFLRDLYLPVPDERGIIPQDDSFLLKPVLPGIEKYRNAAVRQTVLQDFTREQVNELQVLKQADTVMLLNLFPSLFPPEVVKKNVLYYEARTIHDSSLSYCAHAQALAAVGETGLAENYFQKCLRIDWNDNPMDSRDGIHAASLGGIWNCILQGFAGVRCENRMLQITPQLPSHWKSLDFPLMLRGCLLRIHLTGDSVTVSVEEGVPDGITLCAAGKSGQLSAAHPLTIVL